MSPSLYSSSYISYHILTSHFLWLLFRFSLFCLSAPSLPLTLCLCFPAFFFIVSPSSCASVFRFHISLAHHPYLPPFQSPFCSFSYYLSSHPSSPFHFLSSLILFLFYPFFSRFSSFFSELYLYLFCFKDIEECIIVVGFNFCWFQLIMPG